MIFQGTQTLPEKVADRLGYIIDKGTKAEDIIKEYLTDGLHPWYEIYDFIDVHLSLLPEEVRPDRCAQYNQLLEAEKSGYRVVSGEIAPITDKSEIISIEEATNSPYQSVNQHIRKALALYANLKTPDYENSIKESISAVEAMCCIITGLSGANATLGKAIKQLNDRGIYIHKAMKNAFLSLYGYTSDENGIRHGGIDFHSAPAEDAKYMLVSCSAFVGYLIEKWAKAQENETQIEIPPQSQ